jgi:hypothetical protein
MVSSGMFRRVALVRTYVPEKPGMIFLRSVRRLLVAACSPIFVTLMKEAPSFSETSVLTRATWRNIPDKDHFLCFRVCATDIAELAQ